MHTEGVHSGAARLSLPCACQLSRHACACLSTSCTRVHTVQGGSKSASAPQISASAVPSSARGQSTQAKAAVLDSPSTLTRLPRTLTAPEPEKASTATRVWSCWQFRQDVAQR
jgi:hypothetical protein